MTPEIKQLLSELTNDANGLAALFLSIQQSDTQDIAQRLAERGGRAALALAAKAADAVRAEEMQAAPEYDLSALAATPPAAIEE